jgi:hypothetical protein
MYRKDVNEHSPLRILEQSLHGGLGPGNLGVVMAPPGAGKTACLVQIGLDDLLRDREVLHVAIGQTVEHVAAWYDALFEDLARQTGLADRDAVRDAMARRRVIKAFAPGAFSPDRLDEAMALFARHLKLRPQAILVDGFEWSRPMEETAWALSQFKGHARRSGAELWMTAATPRALTSEGLGPPCEDYAALIDVALSLQPEGDHVCLRLVKDHENAAPAPLRLKLRTDTLRLFCDGEATGPARVPAKVFTLLSGGAEGAEEEFGACAERWGLAEETFSFPGRVPRRSRGLVELSDEELRLGDVSTAYVAARMHRTYPETPLFRKVLQSIWHQVNTAGEVFCVGQLQEDSTVRGGTGWAVELARHWNKPVHVFDQERRGWYAWTSARWEPCAAEPVVTQERFTGTGTRFLSDAGRAAIRALFERSFGPAPE